MARVWRLRPRGEFERIRQNGRAWPHRFFVLIVLPCAERCEKAPRVGVAAGKKLGSAVRRNRYKRQLREAIRQIYPNIQRGADIILIARAPMAEATVVQLVAALTEMLQRAKVWQSTMLVGNEEG